MDMHYICAFMGEYQHTSALAEYNIEIFNVHFSIHFGNN